ncbi:MAG: PAS domain-containing protein [Bacteroides sp.]|nr:PAS domain-containing protein [Bacteroides sp.]
MRIKHLFTGLTLLLLLLAGAVIYFLDTSEALPFYAIIAGFAGLFAYLSYFYRKTVKPLLSIDNGMELLREQDFSSRLSPVGQYEADRVVKVFNRMMDQLKSERLRLREQNVFLDLLMQASPMGVMILTLDGELDQMNSMAEKILGVRIGDVRGRKLSQLNIPLAHELDAMPYEETRMVRLNDANIYKCTCAYFLDHGFRHPFYFIERMTEELIKAEKRAYEKVIRMIAHEVNNSTAGITSALDTVSQALPDDEEGEEMKALMQVCTDRSYSMSRFITRFADVVKIPQPLLAPVSLNEPAIACKRFMEGMCNEQGIRLSLHCDEAVGEVEMDAALFEQVLVNIIKNAVESIAPTGLPGEIRIITQAPDTIIVEDDGPGLSHDTETKLFTPFFSTKPNGQGIGLVFIREVLSRHGCVFSLRTDADGKTRFSISF